MIFYVHCWYYGHSAVWLANQAYGDQASLRWLTGGRWGVAGQLQPYWITDYAFRK